jgi:type I restriction enzyme, S subunit
MSQVLTIDDLIETLIDYRGKTPPKSESGVPLITAKVIKGGAILDQPREYIADEIYDSWMRRGVPMSGDILVTTEAPLGEVAQVGPDARIALAQRVILLRADAARVDRQFLFHYLRSPQARASLLRRASGTTVSGIRQPELRAVEIPLLPRPQQEVVGQVLDALDGLINNNRRRVQVLEEMARAIYREWFVHFRYPGYESAKQVDSPLGALPQGWEWGRVDTHFVLQRGFDLPASEREPGSVPIIGASGVQGFHSTAKAHGPGLTTGRSGTVGVVTYVPDDFWPLNTSLWVKEFRLSTPRHAYFLLSSIDLMKLASGAAVPTLNRNVVHALPAICPPRSLIELWDVAAAPMFDSMDVLRRQNRRLEELRDCLLPRLVTGQIDVSSLDLDAIVEDSVV